MIKVSLITSLLNDSLNSKFNEINKLMTSFNYEVINSQIRQNMLTSYQVDSDNKLDIDSLLKTESKCYSESQYIFINVDDFDASIMVALGRLHCLAPNRIITFSTRRLDSIQRNQYRSNCRELQNPFMMSMIYKHLDHWNDFVQFLVSFSIEKDIKMTPLELEADSFTNDSNYSLAN